MSFLPVVMMIALSVSAVPKRPTNDPAASATQFIDLLVRRDFAAAELRMDAIMRQVMPVEKLTAAWDAIEARGGKFSARLGHTVTPVAHSNVVTVTCQFAREKLDLRVTIDPSGEVSGFFVAPTPAPWVAAPYVKPDAFRSEDFTVGSGPLALPGTLTIPSGSGPFPAVILVHGSGPNDRDESVGGAKVFRDLAEGLSSRGIIVLRYEKRTRAHPAPFMTAPFTVDDETTDDAVAAAAQLRERRDVDPGRVVVLGHSLGGMMAPRIAQRSAGIGGIVILAGTARPLEDVILAQTEYLGTLPENSNDAVRSQLQAMRAAIPRIRALTPADSDSREPLIGAPARYWLDLRSYHPAEVARELKIPILVMQGERDYQVTMADFDIWKRALGGKPNVTLKLYPGLNHLQVTGTGPSRPSEYQASAHVAALVVEDIAAWVSRLPSAPHP
jgi:uncharacterized protein